MSAPVAGSTSRVRTPRRSGWPSAGRGPPNQGKYRRAVVGIGHGVLVGHQRGALVGPEEVGDLDPEALAPGPHQPIGQRRRPRADDPQAGEVGMLQQAGRGQHAGQQRGRGERVADPFLRDLREERGQVEGMVLHEPGAGDQPRHEHPAEPGHVDQRERAEDHVVGGEPGAAAQALPITAQPLAQRGHALRYGLGARGPAEGDDLGGVLLDPRHGAAWRELVERDDASGQLRAEGEHRRAGDGGRRGELPPAERRRP